MFPNLDFSDDFPISLGLWIFFGGRFPCVSAGKEPICNEGDLGLIPGLEDHLEKGKATHSVLWPREFHGQYSPWCFEELDMTEQLSHSLSLHGFGGKKTAEVECPFNHVTRSTRLITGNADFYHLAEVVFVRLYHCQVTPFSPSPYCCIFWKEVTTCNSLFRNRELHSTSLKVELSMPTI